MNAEQYTKLSAPFRSATASALLRKADKALTLLFYALYPLLIALLILGLNTPDSASTAFHPLLIPCIVAPVGGFLVVSIMRKTINAPRPYEALDISPLIIKDTKGQSFPSKHVFSSFCIAMCWLAYSAPVGCMLLVCAACIAAIRILGGVHWPRDVFAATLLGLTAGLIIFFW